MRRSRGFTFIELLVAFTILGMMAAIIFSSFRMTLNSYDRGQQRLEDEARRRVLADLIKRQIGSLFPVSPSGSFLEGQEGTETSQGTVASLQGARYPLFEGTPEAVTFVTVAPLRLFRNPGMTVVRYGLARDEKGHDYLGALESRYLGLESFQEMAGSPAGTPLPLVEKISSLQFEYYGYDPQSESYQWFSSWRGEERLGVPRAIRITYDDRKLVVSTNAEFFRSGLGARIRSRLRSRGSQSTGQGGVRR